jgi:hypothetical protein
MRQDAPLVLQGNSTRARRRIALRSGNRNAWTTFEGPFASLSLPMNRTSDAPGRSKGVSGAAAGLPTISGAQPPRQPDCKRALDAAIAERPFVQEPPAMLAKCTVSTSDGSADGV